MPLKEKDIKRLLKGLSGKANARKNALRSLFEHSVKPGNEVLIVKAGAVPPLVGLLTDAQSAVRQGAVKTLANLAYNEANKAAIAEAGAILPLVALLKDAQSSVREGAALALNNLTLNEANQVAIAEAGAIPRLVALLTDERSAVRESSAGALGHLARYNEANKAAIVEAGAIRPLVALLTDEQSAVRERAAAVLASLGRNEANQVTIAEAGAISSLVVLLKDAQSDVRDNAALALSNLANNEANQAAIAEAGAIPFLVALLKEELSAVREGAALALANLASNNEANRAAIAEAGAIPPLVVSLIDEQSDVREVAAGALRNLASNEANQAAIAEAGAIPPLVALLKDERSAVREGATSTLGHLAHNEANRVTIAEAGAIPHLVALLTDQSAVRDNAASTLGHLALNAANQAAITEAGAIPHLVALLTDAQSAVREAAAGALSNLPLGNEANRAAIAETGAISLLIDLLSDVESTVRKNAARALTNLVSQIPPEQIETHKSEPLGSGSFGQVFRGTWKKSPESELPVAVKEISVRNGSAFLGCADELPQDSEGWRELYEKYVLEKTGSRVSFCLYFSSDQSWNMGVLRVEHRLDGSLSRVSCKKTSLLQKDFQKYLRVEAEKNHRTEEEQLASHGLSPAICGTLFKTDYSTLIAQESLRDQMQTVCALSSKKSREDEVDALRKELTVLQHFDHPNLVKFYGYSEDATLTHTLAVSLVMKRYLEDLRGRIHSRVSSISESQALRFALQMLSGLAYLHDKYIVHGDLKPENMLLDADDTLVLADFGLSTSEHEGRVRGTFNYMAPELLRGGQCNTIGSDIYSVGVVIWQLLSREYPWHGKSPDNVRTILDKGDNLLINRDWAAHYRTWLPMMWRRIGDPAGQRPGAKEIYAEFKRADSEGDASQSEVGIFGEQRVGQSSGGGAKAISTLDEGLFSALNNSSI